MTLPTLLASLYATYIVPVLGSTVRPDADVPKHSAEHAYEEVVDGAEPDRRMQEERPLAAQ